MTKPASPFNTEFDSRILRVSVGAKAVTRPKFTQDGALQKVYCLHCGKDGGAVTSSIPVFLKGDPGVIYICDECHEKLGKLPGAHPLPEVAHSFGPAGRYVR